MSTDEKYSNEKRVAKGATAKPIHVSLPIPAAQEQTLFIQQAIDLATQYHQLGNLPKAESIYQQILQVDPNQPTALHFLGLIAHQIGENDRAVKLIGDALKIKPDYLDALGNLGNALVALNECDDAIVNYQKALNINPNTPELYNAIGLAYRRAGDLDRAIENYEIAVSKNPKFTEAYNNLGNALVKSNKAEEGIINLKKSLALNPNFVEAFYNLGLAYYEVKQFEEAVASYKKAIAIKPYYAEAYSDLGIALQENGQLDEAVAFYNKAISIKPDFAKAYSNLGNALNSLMQLDEAVVSYKKAISISPDLAEAYSNLGKTLNGLMQLDEALASYDKAISIKPDFAGAYWNKSLALLLCGKFESGWELYEWRWDNKENDSFKHKRIFTQPLWLGVEPLKGKTILLHSEQGLGDTIQFCRYANLVKALGARVLMEVPKSLLFLLQDLEGVDKLIEKGKPLPRFDYYCPLMSLPLAFKTELNTIPSLTPYFESDRGKVVKWRGRLGKKTTPRIGLVWSGSVGHINDHNRSLSLDVLMQHLPNHFEYVCLQNEIRDSDQEALKKSSIKYFGSEISDFKETAALCEAMDLVISVDTCVAHLSGALGKPTWVLLPYAPDWRWLLDRDDSPWYGTIKLYRQSETRNWEFVLQRCVKDLIKLTQ